MQLSQNNGCLSRKGTPLRCYSDVVDAEEAADDQRAYYDRHLKPYKCNSCGKWHLCSADRNTPSHDCGYCSKRAYETEAGAYRRANILCSERGVSLRVYACPAGEGWHLTSH